MSRKKTQDPKLVALLDKRARSIQAYDRYYSKVKRYFNALDRERQRLIRLARQIALLESTHD